MPKFAGNIFSNLDKKTTSQAEILFALTYCIALESGFYPLNIKEDDLTFSSLFAYSFSNILKISNDGYSLANHCLDEDFYRIELKYPVKTFQESPSETLCSTFVLSGVKSSDFLIVTLTMDGVPGRSVCLSLSRHILPSTKKEFSYRLRNLKELSNLLKEDVFVPLRNTLIAECSPGSLVYPGLQGLPFDIIELLLEFLTSEEDLQNLSKTCTAFRDICKNEYLRRSNQ